MPRYCARCILPDSRPGVKLDPDGVCGGCRNAEVKRHIDWVARRAAFDHVVERTKARNARYDCVIPVSGGKDSFWQVITCLEAGLRPLCATYVYPGRTALGEANLRALIDVGVDHIELRPNPRVERHFIRRAFLERGISGLVSHMAIYTWPIRVAVDQGIPLVVYGENSAFEYGSEDESLTGVRVDSRWLRSFGVTDGTTAGDWVDDQMSAGDLASFYGPSEQELEDSDTSVIFLGWHTPWDPLNSKRIAEEHGFSARKEGARVGHYDFVNIDDDMLGVHHHAKWHKFGITRSWDTLSMEIRAGRMTRDQAIEQLRVSGDETPWDDIAVFCDYVGISLAEYHATLERFRNRDVWTRRDGRWVIDGFLVPDFEFPADAPVAR